MARAPQDRVRFAREARGHRIHEAEQVSPEEMSARAKVRMELLDNTARYLHPLIYATNDVDKAQRLYAVGARTFEDAEKMLPCLGWLERSLHTAPAEGRLERKRRR